MNIVKSKSFLNTNEEIFVFTNENTSNCTQIIAKINASSKYRSAIWSKKISLRFDKNLSLNKRTKISLRFDFKSGSQHEKTMNVIYEYMYIYSPVL